MNEKYRVFWSCDGEAFYVVFDEELEQFDANGFLLEKKAEYSSVIQKPFLGTESVHLTLIKNQ